MINHVWSGNVRFLLSKSAIQQRNRDIAKSNVPYHRRSQPDGDPAGICLKFAACFSAGQI
jgi:hypothetical protein